MCPNTDVNASAAAADLRTRSKIIDEEVKHKKVAIVSGVYSLKTGKVEWTTPVEKKKEAPEKIKLPGAALPAATEGIPALATTASNEPTPYVGATRFPRLRTLFGRNR